jgi:hypothetical protein
MGGEEEPWEWGSVRSGALWRYCGTTERSGTKGPLESPNFNKKCPLRRHQSESNLCIGGFLVEKNRAPRIWLQKKV